MTPTLIYTSAGHSVVFGPGLTYHVDMADVTGLDGISNDIYSISSMAQDGESFVSSRMLARDITVTGSLNATDDANGALRRRLLSLLNPKNAATLTYAGEVNRIIDVRLRSAPQFKDKDLIYPSFTFQLTALNPFWRDPVKTSTNIALWLGMMEFPLELNSNWQIGQRSPSLIVDLINQGDVSTGLEITFRAIGEVEGPALINVRTQRYLRFGLTMQAGDALVVTTGYGQKRAYLNRGGVESDAFGYMDMGSTFLQADPGDNLLRYDADSGLDALEVVIKHSNLYLGV